MDALLIIEDSRLEQGILESMARSCFRDCSIDIAGDSLMAESLIRRRSYDCITVDINIPGIDGLQLLPELRRQCPGARIAIISACIDIGKARSEIEALGVEFLPKPVDEADFLAFLSRGAG